MRVTLRVLTLRDRWLKQDSTEAGVMAVTQRPIRLKSFTTKSGPPAWKHLPSWYLISADDQMIPAPAQEFMGKRMGATARGTTASHATMMAHPNEVSASVLQAVDSIGSQ